MMVIIVYLQNMGTSQSRGRQEQYIQVNHPRFSNSKIVSINSVKVLETQINTQEKSYERWRSSISSHNIDPKKYRFLLLPLRDSNIDKCAVCTNRRNVTATYDNYPLLLTDAIDFLRNKHSTFSEPELWHLLYAICAAEEEISSINGHQSKLGDVRPQNVFLSEKGKIKLANEYSWPGEFNSYEKLLDGQSSYLAPEDMEDLRTGTKRPDFGTNESSQLFAVGLTMLSAGILKENGDLYDTHKMRFDKPEFLRRINFWLTRQRYSETLRILVAYLCNLRVYKRWSFSELWRWLSKHRAKIGAHEFSGNDVQLPELFRQETDELKLNAPNLAELPQTYTNQLYKEYEPRVVLSDKTAKENETQQELKAINLRKSNVSNKSKNNKPYVSPNMNAVLQKVKEEKKEQEEKKEAEPKSIQTSRVEDAKIRELIELVEQQRLEKQPEKSAADPVVSTVDAKDKKESPAKPEQKSFILDGTTSQVKPVEIENGNINIPFISNNPPKNPNLEKDLAYSYPYHPQFYNPHVRYVSPSRKIEPPPPNKQSIFFTYSQVGASQAKSQVRPKEDIKNPKKSIAGSNAGSQVSSQKVIIEHKVQKINSPKKGLNEVATVKKEGTQGKNEANKSNKSGKSQKQALNVDKNPVSTEQKGQNSNNKVNPSSPIQIVQSQVISKKDADIDTKKPVEAQVSKYISNQNEQKPSQDPTKTPIKKEIAETNSSRLRKSGSSDKSQALKKSDELSKNGKGVESSKKIIVTTNNKITTKKSIQKSAGEIGIKKEQEPSTKGKDVEKSIKSIKQPSIPGIQVDIHNPYSDSITNDDKIKDPTSLKVIKERPAALIGVTHDKAKSPVSSPVLSPKTKLPTPSSPKGTSNKLAVSAVVPTENSANKPTNKFTMSTVSRKDGQHIYLRPEIQMPKKDTKISGVTKIRSVKQIEPMSIIKKIGQEKEAKLLVNKEGGNKQKLIGDKKPIFEVNNKSLLQSKVAITSRVQPSFILEEPVHHQVEEKKEIKNIDQCRKSHIKDKQIKQSERIKETDFEDHGIFNLETLIQKKPEERKTDIIEQPSYEKQFSPNRKSILNEDVKKQIKEEQGKEQEKMVISTPEKTVPQAQVSIPHVEVPKTHIEVPQAELPQAQVSIPQAKFPLISTSSHHVPPPIPSISPQLQPQLSSVHKPFIPINQPEISPILIVDDTTYPSELQNIISPNKQQTINSNPPASSQTLPNVIKPFEQFPSPINKKKNTITSQSDVDQQYLQYFEHQEPKVIQSQKKPAEIVPAPDIKKEASIIPQPTPSSKIAEEPKQNKSTEKRSISNPSASHKKFKINEQVLKFDIVPQQKKQESPPKSEKSIKKISPVPSAKAPSQKKSNTSQAKLDIKYAQVVPVDNKSFKLSIVQYQNKPKSKIQSKVEEKKSTINLLDLQKKSIKSENKKETESKIVDKPVPSKPVELVSQISQKTKTKSQRIFDKKEIVPPIQIEIPQPSEKSSVVKVVPKGSNIVEKKKSEIDMKKLDVTPVKISQKKSQIKQEDSRSQARSRLSAISQQKSDRSHLSRKSRKRIDFQHEGHIDFKFISTAQLDKKSVSGQDIKFIKNPTESEGNENRIEAQLIHLRKLGSDGKSIHSFREIKNIHFKHDADDEARYSIRDGAEQSKNKNFVEVNEKYRNMTPNKLITKDKTRSQKFSGLKQEIQSQKTIRYPHEDAPVINILERWKLEKIQENSKVSEKKDVSKEGAKKQESKISFDNNQNGNSKLVKEKSEIEVASKKSQASGSKNVPVTLPKNNVQATPKPVTVQKATKNESTPKPFPAPAKPSSNMDMIDDLLGFNRQPIRRQRNQDVKAAPEKQIHSPSKVETQRKEIKSAPKEIGSDKNKKIAGGNKDPSIINEIKQDNESKVEGDTKSQMRLTRFHPRTPQQSQVQHREFKRRSRKHIDFQHDGHIDFKFIEKVKLDGKASSILQNDVKFIKNPSQSGGDSNHIEAQLIHLRNLGTDGKSIRSYRDIKDIKFKHDADDEVQYSIKEGTEQSHIRNLVTVGQNYLTPNKDTFKERTKTQRFQVKDNPASQTVRVTRKTERFTSQKSGLPSKLLSSVEPVLEIESPVKEKQSEIKSSTIIPVPIESKKEITRTTPNRLQSKPGYNNDLIDDLLGFGKPKKQQQVQPKPTPVTEQKSTFADKFIEEVKETNRIIRDQKNKKIE